MASKIYDRKRHGRRSGRKTYRPKGAQRISPFLGVFIGIIVFCAAGALVLYLLPGVTDIDVGLFKSPKETPQATATPEPTSHPLKNIDIDELQQDVTVTDTSFQWFADATAHNGTLMFCAGEIVNGDAYMTALMEVNTDSKSSKTARRVNLVLENDHIMYATFNDNWLVYLDAKNKGGGKIKFCEYNSDYSKAKVVKEVYTGHPALFLSGNYLAWTERTGTSMDKLFICDLSTMENATVQTFNRLTCYGVSKPHLLDNMLVWADVDSENSTGSLTSQVCILDVESGEYVSYKPGMYVHDPKCNGKDVIAWMTGNHGPDSDLYVSYNCKDPELVAEGVVDFYMGENFIAYQRDQAVFVYTLSTKETYRITRNVENAQIIGVSENCVIWNEIASGNRETLKFAEIPE